jgi:sialate O-acetylesterase
MKIGCVACCFFAWIITQKSYGEVKLPRLVSDGMVLQRGASGGQWELRLPPTKEGGPYQMEIVASNRILINNIMVGDVWVCSGQSNMVIPMERVKYKYAKQIAESENLSIRQFLVPNEYDFEKPRNDLSAGNWESANPRTVLHFSAVAYFFAKALFEKYHVPVGLINASVGGAPVDAWLSEEALKSFPAHLQEAQKWKNPGYIDSIREAENKASNAWYANLWRMDQGLQGPKKWLDSSFDAKGWATMRIPGYWVSPDKKPINGVMWFRKECLVPDNMIGIPAILWLGRIVDRDSVYVNGVFVGTTGYQYPPRIYQLPSNLLRPGKNTIVIRIINSAGNGGFIKDKTYALMAGGHTIGLEGSWQYKLGAQLDPLPAQTFFQYKPVGLFNGVLSPLLQYTIKGVIWYQGEGDLSHPKEYKGLFSAMIGEWRKGWQEGNFPFLYVQLTNYLDNKDPGSPSRWAELREAQRKTLAVPNTGMAVGIDIGEWNDLHPLNKEDVGKRLALAARHLAYADNQIVYSGPMYKSMEIEGNKILLHFSHAGSGLIARGGDSLKYFFIAGTDKQYVAARTKILGDKILVWSEGIKKPVAVRYAWSDNPAAPNFYNRDGLPASPFCTDD